MNVHNALRGHVLPGQYAGNGGVEYLNCPLGHQCPYNATSSPIQCTQGTYANVTGSDSCLVCPAGYECASPIVTPQFCHRRFYSRYALSILQERLVPVMLPSRHLYASQDITQQQQAVLNVQRVTSVPSPTSH